MRIPPVHLYRQLLFKRYGKRRVPRGACGTLILSRHQVADTLADVSCGECVEVEKSRVDRAQARLPETRVE